jgi:aspartate--ammonia ligase
VLQQAFEISSVGIRVDKKTLIHQPEIAGVPERKTLLFHSKLLNDELLLSIGGGIGQYRLCMYFLHKAHIGEVQTSLWPDEMIRQCEEHNIFMV